MMNLPPNEQAIIIADQPRQDERRRHRRYSARVKAILHGGGRSQPTMINDLSAGGAGLDSALGVAPNDAVVLELADGRRLVGMVAWRISGCCGIQFDQELSETDPLLIEVAAASGH